MAKTTKPVTIIALPPCHTWEELAEYEQQGHTVIRIDLPEHDIVIGDRCWRMTDKHRPYLKLAVAGARKWKSKS